MSWGNRAPWGRSEDRCDGMAPKQAAPNPQSNRARCARSGGVWFLITICFGESPSSGLRIKKSAKTAAAFPRRSLLTGCSVPRLPRPGRGADRHRRHPLAPWRLSGLLGFHQLKQAPPQLLEIPPQLRYVQ